MYINILYSLLNHLLFSLYYMILPKSGKTFFFYYQPCETKILHRMNKIIEL